MFTQGWDNCSFFVGGYYWSWGLSDWGSRNTSLAFYSVWPFMTHSLDWGDPKRDVLP